MSFEFEKLPAEEKEEIDSLLDKMNSLNLEDSDYEEKINNIKKRLAELVGAEKEFLQDKPNADSPAWEEELVNIKKKADEVLPEIKIEDIVENIKSYLPMIKSAARDRIIANDGDGAKELSLIYNTIIEEFRKFGEKQADVTQERLIAFNEWLKEMKEKAENIINGEDKK